MDASLFDCDSPLTFEDVAEYLNRLGNKSPTPGDAIRFGSLAMRVEATFSDEQKKWLQDCKKEGKISRSAVEAILAAHTIKTKKEKEEKKKPTGAAGATKEETSKGWTVHSGDGLSNKTTVLPSEDSLPADRACGYCHKKARLVCSGCKGVFFCDAVCQRKLWKTHKSECRLSSVLDELGKARATGGAGKGGADKGNPA
jgi:hypothetical protein